jgi:hypothetical protein
MVNYDWSIIMTCEYSDDMNINNDFTRLVPWPRLSDKFRPRNQARGARS